MDKTPLEEKGYAIEITLQGARCCVSVGKGVIRALGCPTHVSLHHLWIECEQRFYRVMYANFTGLEHLSITEEWRKVGEMLWGYPEILDYLPPHIFNRLAEPELGFDSLDALQDDWLSFQAEPVPNFIEFCNDIFGDG